MVERDQRKGAEGPEDKGVRQAGERALANDFGLEEHLPDEVPDAFAEGEEMKAGIFLRLQDFVEDDAEAPPEAVAEAIASAGKSSFSKREK